MIASCSRAPGAQLRAVLGCLTAMALACLVLGGLPSPTRAAIHDPVPDLGAGAVPAHASPRPVATAARGRSADPVAHAASLPYGGGSVLHWNRTHLVFWLPSGAGLAFDPGYISQLETFLARVAHDSHLPTNVYSVSGQYYDESGHAVYASTYAGAIIDTDPLPPRDLSCQEPPPPPVSTGPPGWNDCVTDGQIQTELTNVVHAHHLPATLQDIYFLVTPNGLGDCFTSTTPAACALGGEANNGYCGYHSNTFAGLLYAVIPYNALAGHCESDAPRPNASTADPTLSTLSHEHNETITDPLGDAWIDGSGNEEADLCLDQSVNPPRALGGSGSSRYDQVIDGGHYWLQLEWSNDANACVARARADSLSLSVPRSATAGASIRLRVRGRDPDGRIVSYRWSFGDRSTGRGSAPKHRYRRAGVYTIVVRSTDSNGLWAFVTRRITIRRAPARRRHPAPRRR